LLSKPSGKAPRFSSKRAKNPPHPPLLHSKIHKCSITYINKLRNHTRQRSYCANANMSKQGRYRSGSLARGGLAIANAHTTTKTSCAREPRRPSLALGWLVGH
jgi:hypothetical protein